MSPAAPHGRPLPRFLRTSACALAAGLLATACGPTGSSRPNILLITLDTTRADRLGCYGYEHGTTPHLDALAAESTLYTRAYSTSSWTLPAHASLFTGKLPTAHGARYDPEGPLALTDAIEGSPRWRQYRARALPASERTLAAVLGEHGYATGAVVAGPWMMRIFGLGAGFQHYDDGGITKLRGRLAADVTDAAQAWVERHAEEPFFLFLNYYDPHVPYRPPDEFLDRFVPKAQRTTDGIPPPAERSKRYDAEIHYMDHHIGRFVARLRQLDLYERTWIIVTADHGELLGEHGKSGHGVMLWEPEIRVPLLVKPPGRAPAGGRSDEPVQLTDIAPFILSELGLPLPADAHGQPLGSVTHPIVAEYHPLPVTDPDGPYAALLELPYKLVRDGRAPRWLFDLQADPAETENLLERDVERIAAMDRRLRAQLELVPAPAPAATEPGAEVDEETLEALKSLGYVD